MRAAKLEIKIAIALFLSKLEYQVVDASGHFPGSLPQPDRNDIQQMRLPSIFLSSPLTIG
jgi:sterol 14-demethylase